MVRTEHQGTWDFIALFKRMFQPNRVTWQQSAGDELFIRDEDEV